MSNILTTIIVLLTLGIAIETSSLSLETTIPADTCGGPFGNEPPPPTN